MLFLILYLQSPKSFDQIGRIVTEYSKENKWSVGAEDVGEIILQRYVSLQTFAFMTNHFHLAVCERQNNGITRYMQRLLNAYAKYFNTKYETVGHLFQGPYRAVHVDSNEQLLHLSAYIHRNPRDLAGVAGEEHQYPWSSYQDYLGDNRFAGLLDTELVLGQFDNQVDYRDFVDSSSAKAHTEFLSV